MSGPSLDPGLGDWFAGVLASAAEPALQTPAAPDDLVAMLRLRLAIRGRTPPAALLPETIDAPMRLAVLEAMLGEVDADPAGRGWLLRDGPRRAVLAGFREPRLSALQADPAPDDETWQALCRLQVPARLQDLTTGQLRALTRTLDAVGLDLTAWTAPDAANAAQTLHRRSRREAYALGAAGFIGRQWDRRYLYAFLHRPAPPSQAAGTVQALVIGGAGGSGKSALLAHVAGTLLDATPCLPLVHLDFDRPSLDPMVPSTLDLELLRQLALCAPPWSAELADRASVIQATFNTSSRRGVSLEAAGSDSLAGMEGSLHWLEQPLLLLLDTAEQVLCGGRSRINALLDWIGRLAVGSGAPEVRVVIAGRDDPEDWVRHPGGRATMLAGGSAQDRTRVRHLPDLGPKDAAKLLVCRDVPAALAPALAIRFGGNPLVLRLIADLVRAGDTLHHDQVPEGLVQGYLYDRILKHLAEPGRSFAHPGVALPAITLSMVAGILAPAKGVKLTEAEATAVFESLAAPSWLMRRTDDTLRLRPDLRRLTVRLIAADPARAAEMRRVHKLAMAWHAQQAEPGQGVEQKAEHRAMSLYHQLMLGGTPDNASLPVGAAPVLLPLLDDLPQAATAMLRARLGLEMGEQEAAEQLSDEDWKTFLGDYGGAGSRLASTRSPREALALWRSRPAGEKGDPPTFVLQALAESGDWEGPEADDNAVAKGLTYGRASGQEPSHGPPGQRLYWATCLALLRPPHRLPEPLAATLRAALRGPVTHLWRPRETVRLAALAQILSPNAALLLDRRALGVELSPRIALALAPHRPGPALLDADMLVVAQRDWRERLGHGRGDAMLWPRAEVEHAQTSLDAMHGQSIATVAVVLRGLSERRAKPLATGRGTAERMAPFLRDTTPELHRPAREALAEALTDRRRVEPVLHGLRPHLSICPEELEPGPLTARLARDAAAWWLQMVQFADSARVLGILLDLAAAERPAAPRLHRVAATFHAWDRALGHGWPSAWTLPGQSYGPG